MPENGSQHRRSRRNMPISPFPRIFLSASIPSPSRNEKYFRTADVIAIRDSLRALVTVALQRQLCIVFGGHPAITPMISLQISNLDKPVESHFLLYQSQYFLEKFPAENKSFSNVEIVPKINNDRTQSLEAMRVKMLDQSFVAAIFIGGMEGVVEEFELFSKLHPNQPVYPIASTGAAAALLYEEHRQIKKLPAELKSEISYLTLLRKVATDAFTRQPGPNGPSLF